MTKKYRLFKACGDFSVIQLSNYRAFITYTVIKGMEALGPAKAVMLIVISQLILAYVIEVFGFFGVEKQPLELRRVIGMGIAIVGVVIFKWT